MTSPVEPDEVAAALAAVEADREERRKEWGVYVATEAIFILGARAFNEGDAVPISHVERGVVRLEQVRKVQSVSQKKG